MTSLGILLVAVVTQGGPDPCALTVEGEIFARDACLRRELKLFNDSSLAPEAIRTVAAIGTPAVRSLLDALRDTSELVRANAADALGRIAAKELKGEEVIDALIGALKDNSRLVRRQAAGALSRIGPGAVRALPALAVAEEDPDSVVRALASAAIRKISKVSTRESTQ
jgi:HEAT repeat protein